MVRMEVMAPMVQPVRKGPLARQARMEPMVQMVLPVRKVLLALQVLLVRTVRMEVMVSTAPMVQPGLKDQLAHQVQMEPMV